MSPLGWHPPHLLDNTDTQYLGDQHWHQCWFFRFLSFFVSFCLSMFQLVYVFVCFFTINFKFLKTIDLLSLYMWAFNSGLELKKYKLCLKMFCKFFQKIRGKALVSGFCIFACGWKFSLLIRLQDFSNFITQETGYIKLLPRHYSVTRYSRSQCFRLVMVRHTQFFLDQSDCNILETPITRKRF